MDLNELLRAHQVEVMKASASRDEATRESHFSMVAKYADQIRKLRNISPNARVAQYPSAPDTIIYGTYAGSSAAEVPVASGSDADVPLASEAPRIKGQADS